MPSRLLALVLAVSAVTGCSEVAVLQEAPEACGFPPGTALSFAGRSTTSALGVQEVVGDPMSDDPADIYITRDKFDQGAHHGRLVCAVFVNDPGFVEITVHPADGGRARGEAEPVPTPSPLASDEVEINTHCGLDYARVMFDGRSWKFDVEDQANPPPGWEGNPMTIVQVKRGPDGPIVTGPDGSEWPLIPADDDPPGVCM